MKEWIEKRIRELKESRKIIPLDNWREYYNNLKKDNQEKDAVTQALDHSGRGESPNHK